MFAPGRPIPRACPTQFGLVDAQKVGGTLGAAEPRIAGQFTVRRGPSDIRFGIGDVASVTIFEFCCGGLIPLEAGTRPAIS